MNNITVKVGDIVECETKKWKTKPMLLMDLYTTKNSTMAICQAYMHRINNNAVENVPVGNRVHFPAAQLKKANVIPPIGHIEPVKTVEGFSEGDFKEITEALNE